MNRSVAPFLFAAALFTTPCVWAQDGIADVTDMQALRAAVKTDKRAFVASVLNLSDAEAKKFWPVYESYQQALEAANRQRNGVIIDLVGVNKPVSDPYAKLLVKEVFAADEAEIKARRTMSNKVMRALPPKKAARYLQLESKIRAVQAYDIAVGIPLVK